MSALTGRPPLTAVRPVIDVLHGVSITDPYRWLEDQNSPETRAWIDEQTRYARSYLDALPGRERIRARVRELLDVETFDSFLKNGSGYFFRKRLRGQEQPSIYFREGPDGEDVLLVDPAARNSGDYIALKPLRVSPDGKLLLYEVKHGGERTGIFEILDVPTRTTLRDSLPRGYLRGFAFAPDGKSYYYIHEPAAAHRSCRSSAFHHVLGTEAGADNEVFRAGEGEKLLLAMVSSKRALGFLVYRFGDDGRTDFYLRGMGSGNTAVPILRDVKHCFAPRLLGGRILALVDEKAPNRRIVDVQPRTKQNPLYFDVIPESDAPIRSWLITANHILVLYVRGTSTHIAMFDLFGKRLGEIPCDQDSTVRLLASSPEDDEVLLQRESFSYPIEIVRCSVKSGAMTTWARRSVPFDPTGYVHSQESFPSKDGATIPMSLFRRGEMIDLNAHPAAITSYGGYGVPMTPQFSVFVTLMIERGCIFALPNIRGGSEFGIAWHNAAKRRKRQVAFNDFISSAEWLVQTGRTTPDQLAIFGGSNSGLLVAAVMTQRPELFRAVLCMVPMTDMLRYHLFDNAHVWETEFGTAEDPEDFFSLVSYSPYQNVRDNTPYPATMILSGDSDQICNPLHARKMTAKLQTANASPHPIFLDYRSRRGHSPVMPLSERVNALSDRVAFFCDQLGLTPA